MAKKIRLSQCMIVKNEERHIRRALSWGKDIVCEQIVVDTGSTDATVEIAESMGAKVLHFTWCDDFSAAKNYAIEHAKGDWIAFLDADEYFLPEDAKKIPDILSRVSVMGKSKTAPVLIRSSMMNLSDDGKIFSTNEQDRIFRNVNWLRYRNPIHEVLTGMHNESLYCYDATEELPIMHTGYQASVVQEADKGKRNVDLLKRQLEKNPEDYDTWSYLVDSLLLAGRASEGMEAAEKVILHAEECKRTERRNVAFGKWYRILAFGWAGEEDAEQCKAKAEQYYEKFCGFSANYPDVEYYMGCYQLRIGERKKGIEFLELALAKLDAYNAGEVMSLSGELGNAYYNLLSAYKEEGNLPKVVHYCTLLLRLEPYHEAGAEILLQILKEDKNTSPEQLLVFLMKLYDVTQLKAKLFLLKMAIKIKYKELEQLIREELLTEEEREELDASMEDRTWVVSREELKKAYPDIPVRNRTDQNFLYLMGEIEQKSEENLVRRMKEDMELSESFVPYRATNLKVVKEALAAEKEKLAPMLKARRDDFLWLYQELGDYRSRQCLYAILDNWMHQEGRVLSMVKDNGLQFWDMDLIDSAEGAVYVDIGEKTLSAVKGFQYTYEEMYQSIHCFVQKSEEAVDDADKEEERVKMEEARAKEEEELRSFRDVDYEQVNLEELSLDAVMDVPLDIIRIDTKSPVLPLIEGCAAHIQAEQPRFAICLDNDYNNLWQVPRLLKKLSPDYKLYLRYYGGNLNPERYVLFAI